jgi:tRNA threonylcarbamoyladenosine biosynthesis protein TsaB
VKGLLCRWLSCIIPTNELVVVEIGRVSRWWAISTKQSEEPLILAVETSGRLGSVALAQGAKLLGEQHFTGPMRHSAEVFPAIVGLLDRFGKKADKIEQVYISVGPGSFTGLRIAVTIAKTMALASGAKIIAVDTLDAIAANINPQDKSEQLGVILDAKRGQFFIAVYEKSRGGLEKILPDSLMTAEEFLGRFTDKPIALIGEGLVFYRNNFTHKNIRVLDEKYWNPSAANVHRLGWQMARRGQFTDPIALTPNYLRQPDVKLKQI